ncbi:nucleoporin [Gigaspora margarita]|uniref:Nucleoporin n=1 Tax=Gigaspora margarita TaxID=4874 RepID=A0A8H3WZS0_GIGMA|nr:nucleoporin [Gigaspora margarita]
MINVNLMLFYQYLILYRYSVLVTERKANNLQQSFRATRAITPEGTHKSTVQPSQELQQHYVKSILWLESALFVVAYFPVIQEDLEHDAFIISRETKSKILYIKCPTICSTILSDHLKPPYLYMETIKYWK